MEAERAFPGTPKSVPEARRFVIGHLGHLNDELQDMVCVMVSELTTNAVLYGVGDFSLSLDANTDRLLVSVSDSGPGTPQVQTPKLSDLHGRGLLIVQRLADQWGTTNLEGGGKTVWFSLPLNEESGLGPAR